MGTTFPIITFHKASIVGQCNAVPEASHKDGLWVSAVIIYSTKIRFSRCHYLRCLIFQLKVDLIFPHTQCDLWSLKDLRLKFADGIFHERDKNSDHITFAISASPSATM